MLSGILYTDENFTAAFSAYPLSLDNPATRSPILKSATFDPISIISPETSIPGINGVSGFN